MGGTRSFHELELIREKKDTPSRGINILKYLKIATLITPGVF